MRLIRSRAKKVPGLRTLHGLILRGVAKAEHALPLPVRRIVRFYNACGYMPNLYKPKTFNEKVLYKLRRDRREFIKIAEDKFLARQYVEQKLGSSIEFPKLYGVYEDASGIDPRDLPEEFVMKASYGSGWVKIYRRGVPRAIEDVRGAARCWLAQRYVKESEDWVCPSSKQRILIEEFLSENGAPPIDYKFFCYGGEPTFVETHTNRFGDHREALYDMNWSRMPGRWMLPQDSVSLPRPNNFEKMREAARRLSAEHDFIRVDLYNIAGIIYFGELSNFPGNGLDPFESRELEAELAKPWILPARYQ